VLPVTYPGDVVTAKYEIPFRRCPLNRKTFIVVAAGLILGSLAAGQNPPANKPQAPAVQPANELADALAQRLANELHVKTVVGEPVKIGSLTLIPIMTIDVSFGGGAMAAHGSPGAAAPQSPPMGADGFFMSGEARPLGFVAIGRKGTRFIGVAKTPAK
jgi:uncharacterized spore protein YtfJ